MKNSHFVTLKVKLTVSLMIMFAIHANMMAQTFEGKIVYQASYKSKIATVTDEQLNITMGTKQEYFVKGGSYKIVTNGTFLKWQIFVNKDSKIYFKMGNSDGLLWKDVTVNADEIVKSELTKNHENILGHPCSEFVITGKKTQERYYFSPQLIIDPGLFVNHKLGNWNEFTRMSNALPLKMIISNEQFTMEATAVEILPMKLEDRLFELPAGVKTEKSPF